MRLILIRHAKSSWDDPFQDDHAQILNKRGPMPPVRLARGYGPKGTSLTAFWYPMPPARLRPLN